MKECILKIPSFIKILPKLSLSESLGWDFIASPFSLLIWNFPPSNCNKPSDSIAVFLAFIIYSPSDFSNIIEACFPPLIMLLHSPFKVKISLFSMETVLFWLTFITAHSPVVVFLSSKSFNTVFSRLIILTSFEFLVTIIGEFFLEDKFKFCKYKVTELAETTIFPSSDSPEAINSPDFWITAVFPFLV